MKKITKDDIRVVATFHGSDLPLGIDNDEVVSLVLLREVFSGRDKIFHNGKWCYLIPKEDVGVIEK